VVKGLTKGVVNNMMKVADRLQGSFDLLDQRRGELRRQVSRLEAIGQPGEILGVRTVLDGHSTGTLGHQSIQFLLHGRKASANLTADRSVS